MPGQGFRHHVRSLLNNLQVAPCCGVRHPLALLRVRERGFFLPSPCLFFISVAPATYKNPPQPYFATRWRCVNLQPARRHSKMPAKRPAGWRFACQQCSRGLTDGCVSGKSFAQKGVREALFSNLLDTAFFSVTEEINGIFVPVPMGRIGKEHQKQRTPKTICFLE